jgi:2-dehydropantoate 2-reductase
VKVLIAGAGAVGCWLGARLTGRHDVTLLTRPRNAEAIARDGLHVTGRTRFADPLPCISEPAGHFDAVVLTCKAYDTRRLGAAVAPLTDGFIGSLQNGLGNDAKLAATGRPVALGLTSHGIRMLGPGRIEHAGEGMTRVGPVAGDHATAHAFESLLGDAGLAPVYTEEMQGAIWQKAIINAGINPVGALTRRRNGELLADPVLWSRVHRLVEENYALSRAAGVALPVGDVAFQTEEVLRRTAKNRCSMLQDVENGKRTEIEQINGHFVRLARRLGFPLPENEAVYREVKALEASYLGEAAALQSTRDEVA